MALAGTYTTLTAMAAACTLTSAVQTRVSDMLQSRLTALSLEHSLRVVQVAQALLTAFTLERLYALKAQLEETY